MAKGQNSHKKVLKLLDKFFCWKGTLKEYLVIVCKAENVCKEKRAAIIDDKNPEYQNHLTNIIVASNCNGNFLPKSPVSFPPWCSLDDVIHRVIENCCKRNRESENVLSIGSSLIRHDTFKANLGSLYNVQSNYPNSTVSYVSSPIWELLLSKIGVDVMLHMFAKLSLFVRITNGCLVQLCGKPVAKVKTKASSHSCENPRQNLERKVAESKQKILPVKPDSSPGKSIGASRQTSSDFRTLPLFSETKVPNNQAEQNPKMTITQSEPQVISLKPDSTAGKIKACYRERSEELIQREQVFDAVNRDESNVFHIVNDEIKSSGNEITRKNQIEIDEESQCSEESEVYVDLSEFSEKKVQSSDFSCWKKDELNSERNSNETTAANFGEKANFKATKLDGSENQVESSKSKHQDINVNICEGDSFLSFNNISKSHFGDCNEGGNDKILNNDQAGQNFTKLKQQCWVGSRSKAEVIDIDSYETGSEHHSIKKKSMLGCNQASQSRQTGSKCKEQGLSKQDLRSPVTFEEQSSEETEIYLDLANFGGTTIRGSFKSGCNGKHQSRTRKVEQSKDKSMLVMMHMLDQKKQQCCRKSYEEHTKLQTEKEVKANIKIEIIDVDSYEMDHLNVSQGKPKICSSKVDSRKRKCKEIEEASMRDMMHSNSVGKCVKRCAQTCQKFTISEKETMMKAISNKDIYAFKTCEGMSSHVKDNGARTSYDKDSQSKTMGCKGNDENLLAETGSSTTNLQCSSPRKNDLVSRSQHPFKKFASNLYFDESLHKNDCRKRKHHSDKDNPNPSNPVSPESSDAHEPFTKIRRLNNELKTTETFTSVRDTSASVCNDDFETILGKFDKSTKCKKVKRQETIHAGLGLQNISANLGEGKTIGQADKIPTCKKASGQKKNSASGKRQIPAPKQNQNMASSSYSGTKTSTEDTYANISRVIYSPCTTENLNSTSTSHKKHVRSESFEEMPKQQNDSKQEQATVVGPNIQTISSIAEDKQAKRRQDDKLPKCKKDLKTDFCKRQDNASAKKQHDKLLANSKQKAKREAVYFNISRVLYSSCTTEKLRKNHILYSLTDCRKDASRLALDVFLSDREVGASTNLANDKVKSLSSQSTNHQNKTQKNPQKLPKNLLRSLAILRDFIGKFKKLRIRRVLKNTCPIAEPVRIGGGNYLKNLKNQRGKSQIKNGGFNLRQKVLYRSALLDFTPPEKVLSFIRAVCNKTIPKALLGSKANWKTFYKHLGNFLKLGMHETMSLSQFMMGIKISECTWMFKSGVTPKNIPKSLSEWQAVLQCKLVSWLIGHYVVPLARGYFYVTNSAMHHSRLFYYRKSTWKIIKTLGREGFLNKNLEEVSQATVEDSSKLFGCATTRFIPKANKVRPIVNLQKTNLQRLEKRQLSAHYQLIDLFHVLTFVQKQKRMLFGSAVFDRDDVNAKIRTFAACLKEKKLHDLPKFWIATDIECCFDSIPHDKLIEIIEHVLESDIYVVKRFSVVTFGTGDSVRRSTRRIATDHNDLDTFPVFLAKLLQFRKYQLSNAIVTDCVNYSNVEKQSLISLLKKHVKDSFIEMEGRYYRRLTGIAQGSILSTLLANFLYGNMENLVFSNILNSENSLLMRQTDDFLLVTTSQQVAVEFLNKLRAGFPEYGVQINLSKSLTNLPKDVLGSSDLIKRAKSEWFPWCGLLFNVRDFNVRMNFQKYEGEFIKDCITQRLDATPGKLLKSRVLSQVRNQSLSVILDPEINSPHNLRVNIYQIFCFVAVKLNCQIVNLPKHGQPDCNPSFFKRLIHSIFDAFYSQYRRVKDRLELRTIPIPIAEAKSIYFGAVLSILGRRESRYHVLLKSIRKDLKKLKVSQEELKQYEEEGELFESIR